MQVVYLDVDTLWIDSMANVEQEFAKMREKNALFGMSIETTALNGNGSWYKGGRPPANSAISLMSHLLVTSDYLAGQPQRFTGSLAWPCKMLKSPQQQV